jgi:hypothetical protein
VEFAIGARRIAPLWRILDGLAEEVWTDAVDMPGAQVAVAAWCPEPRKPHPKWSTNPG